MQHTRLSVVSPHKPFWVEVVVPELAVMGVMGERFAIGLLEGPLVSLELYRVLGGSVLLPRLMPVVQVVLLMLN